ncbi:hypothetical protein [Priestia megaterium]|uniref:hypothetical protein n=1 Tax=Priestia megaterium TaxID=1404 RepID=UPI00164999C1|nr:hypothetical protein [Priestia megaterium]
MKKGGYEIEGGEGREVEDKSVDEFKKEEGEKEVKDVEELVGEKEKEVEEMENLVELK